MSANANWYFLLNGHTRGPVSESALRNHLGNGTLPRDGLVWREGMAAWTPAEEVPELKANFQQKKVLATTKPPLALNKPKRSSFLGDVTFYGVGLVIVFMVLIGVSYGWELAVNYEENRRSRAIEDYLLHKHYRMTQEVNSRGTSSAAGIIRDEWIPIYDWEDETNQIYEMMYEVERYVSEGKQGIPEGVDVFVWEVERVIKRRPQHIISAMGLPGRETMNDRFYVWVDEKGYFNTIRERL